MTKDNDDFLAIDEHRLHEEWMGQPRLYYRWGQKLADARQRLDEAKSNLDVTDAELDFAIRESPTDYGLEGRVTEAAIKNTIIGQPQHLKAAKAVLAAKHEVDVLAAATTAIDHRKKALESLVSLHLSGYYATPQARDERSREEMDLAEKKQARRRARRRPE